MPSVVAAVGRMAATISACLLLLALSSQARAATFSEGFEFENIVYIPESTGHAGPGDPYPANLTVSGLPGNVLELRVLLGPMAHTWPADIDMLLVGPGGQQAMLMSDACGGDLILNEFFDIAQAGLGPFPQSACATGTYKPTNYGGFPVFADPLAAPAPPPPAGEIAYPADLAAFNGTDPNGVWRLFASDDSSANGNGGSGGIVGWGLSIHIPARCGGKPATLVGANGRGDRLIGTKRRDVIVGFGGADLIAGKGGRDLICGGKGRDLLIGGPGRDKLVGGKGRDVCRAAKNDKLKSCERGR